MKIGLSLSFCVRDMIDGKVDEKDVALIYAGTCFRDQNDLESVIGQYTQVYWKHKPMQAEGIVRALYKQGRIFQPRLYDMVPPNTGDGHWLEVP